MNNFMINQKIEIGMSKVIAYSGIVIITHKDLEKLKASNRKANIQMVGLLVITKDISLELARETIERVKVHGIVKASSEIKQFFREICC